MKERMVPAQQLSDAGEDLVRLAAAKNAEIALLKAELDAATATFDDEQAAHQDTLRLWQQAKTEIAALTKERDAMRVARRQILDPREVNVYGYKRIARDTLDALDAEAAAETALNIKAVEKK